MIAASIVTYNTDLNELSTCLNCLQLCRQVSLIEIVDNSSSSAIKQFLSENFKNVIYTPSKNIGYGAAHNISMRKSLQGVCGNIKYHLVMNSDIAFMPELMDVLLNKIDSDDTIGLIMPAVINADGSPQSCCHPLPTPIDLLKHRFAPKSMFKRWRKRYDIYPQSIGYDINVPYMHGCFMLFRLEALHDVGLFDERFFMYPEDIDITRRIHEKYKTIVTPDAVMYHLHRGESRQNFRMLKIHAINMLKYFAKWGFVFDSRRKKFNKSLKERFSQNKGKQSY